MTALGTCVSATTTYHHGKTLSITLIALLTGECFGKRARYPNARLRSEGGAFREPDPFLPTPPSKDSHPRVSAPWFSFHLPSCRTRYEILECRGWTSAPFSRGNYQRFLKPGVLWFYKTVKGDGSDIPSSSEVDELLR